MEKHEFAPCWNCGKRNKRQPCGYYMCDCKGFNGSRVLWYLPLEDKVKKQNKLFQHEEDIEKVF